MHLTKLPDVRSARDPDTFCLADDRSELTNAEFAARVRAMAAALTARGVVAGDVVAVILPNRIELVLAMFAAWRVGAALVAH